MRRVQVALYRSNKFVTIDLDALGGATLGENVFWQGKVLDPNLVLNSAGGQTVVVGGDQTTDTVYEGASHLYFTIERAQDAVGTILGNTDDIVLLYDDDTPAITAELTSTDVEDGFYGDEHTILRMHVDSKGRIQSIETIPIDASSVLRVRLATAAALPANTYNNGTAGVDATLTATSNGVLTVDGATVLFDDDIVVKDEAAPAHNGTYRCTTQGTLLAPYELTRVTGMDAPDEFTAMLVAVGPDGTANKNTLWQCKAVSPVTVGTTAITFASAGGGGGTSVSSLNGQTGAITEASADGSIGVTTTTGNIDLSARMLAKLATAAALPTNTYSNGSSGVGATLTGSATGVLTVDGTAVALNDAVFVKDEASGLKCGLYLCTTAGAVGVAYVLTRSTRMDSTAKYVGAGVTILSGTVNGGTRWSCTNSTAPTVGTTAITFALAGLPKPGTKGRLIVDDGTKWTTHTPGADGQIMQFDSGQTDGIVNVFSTAVPFKSLSAEILVDLPTVYYKCNETSGSIIDYGSAAANITPSGSTPSTYIQGFSRQITTGSDKALWIRAAAGAQLSSLPTGIPSVPSGSWTAMIVYSSRSSTATLRVLLNINNNVGNTNAIDIRISGSNLLAATLTATSFGPLAVWACPQTGVNIIHVVKDSVAKTFTFYVNGLNFGGNSYSSEFATTLTAPRLTLGTDSAGTSSAAGLVSHAAIFYGQTLSETRIIAHAQAAGLFGLA
jgi:hypothetical protein